MASKTHSLETDWARAPPPTGPLWRRCANAFYNPDEKSFLGRTPKRWGIILTFYMVFYAVLALLFSACMGGLFLTIKEDMPTRILEDSLIGINPGVALRPRPEDGLIIRYNHTGYQEYIDQLKEFLQPYEEANMLEPHDCTIYDCTCTAAHNYGYPATPCLFIKLNKIINWKPECYNDAANLPTEMPPDLRVYITNNQSEHLNQIWLSCWDETNNSTIIEYPGNRGLAATYYPYLNTPGYLSPVVPVKITPPANHIAIIRCRFWAKNIIYNKSLKEPSGYARIQLSIGDWTSNNATAAHK